MLGERSNCATAVAIMFEFCVEMTRKEVTVQTIGDNHAEIGGGIPPQLLVSFCLLSLLTLAFSQAIQWVFLFTHLVTLDKNFVVIFFSP